MKSLMFYFKLHHKICTPIWPLLLKNLTTFSLNWVKEFHFRTVFGPFEGLLLEDEEETTGKGFFWEIQNPEKTQVVGFVDPGPNPDIVTQWLAYVNCPMDESERDKCLIR